MGLTPYGVIDYADVKVGDLIEINTVTVVSGTVLDVDKEMVKLSTPDGGAGYWEAADQIDFQPASWTAISARDRRVILVNRPEPPKPEVKLGDELDRRSPEPPDGTVLRSPSGIVAVREHRKYHVAQGGGRYDWAGLTTTESQWWKVIHLPGD